MAELSNSILETLNTTISENTTAHRASADAIKEFAASSGGTGTGGEPSTTSTQNFKEFLKGAKDLSSSTVNLAMSSIRKSAQLGTTAIDGVSLVASNFTNVALQVTNGISANIMVTREQLLAAQQAYATAFVSTREGFELSSKGALEFTQNLKTGFKSAFELNAGSLRALTTAGLSTTEQFDNFRKATGRASLGNEQFANIVNKNTLSFLLYGNSFAKAAADAERLGISLASVQAGQESMVMNLDNTIDVIQQLNQLGSTIDFGTLTKINEFEGPQKTLEYLVKNINPALLNEASGRGLINQIPGITPEMLKQLQEGGVTEKTLQNVQTKFEQKKEKPLEAIEEATKAAIKFDAIGGALSANTAATIANTAATAADALSKSATLAKVAAGASAMSGAAGGLVTAASMLSKYLPVLSSVTGGTSLAMMGGQTPGASILASVAGAGLGAGLGFMFGGGPPGAVLGAQIGGWALGGLAGLFSALTGDDVVSSAGYGDRQLVTPTGTIALNNNDTVMAGTNLLSKGALSPESNARTEQLHNKLDTLIGTLNNATTTINVDGQTSTVPRMAVTGVYTRSEKR